MRWYFIPIISCMLFIACDNSIEVNAELKDIPIAFALLDIQDSAHYVRVQRTFSEEGVSAFVLAQDPGRIYYEEGEIEVTLAEVSDGQIVHAFAMQRVDGDSLQLPKEDGIFANSPNILYRHQGLLDPEATYELQIRDSANDQLYTATTILIDEFTVFQPQSEDFPLDFADTGKFTIEWVSAVGGKSYEGLLDFYYTETNPTTGNSILKHVEWQLFSNEQSETIEGFTVMRLQLNRGAFYTYMKNALDPPGILQREFSCADFRITAGGEEIYLLYLNNLANLGLSGMFITPAYTNFEGGALGIFSSRYLNTIPNINISDRTIDSLACGRFTGHLGFAPSPTATGDCN